MISRRGRCHTTRCAARCCLALLLLHCRVSKSVFPHWPAAHAPLVGACAVQAWLWQQRLVAQARERAGNPAEACDDTLLLLQHNSVYTLGHALKSSLC